MLYDQYVEELSKLPMTKELSFSESEYRLRVEKVRHIMDARGLDVLLITFTPNLSYLSGYQSFGSGWYKCMVLPREGEPVLHMHQLEIGPAVLTSWVGDVRGVPWSDERGAANGLADILKERKLENKRIGVEIKKPGLGVDLYEGLKRALPNASLLDASDVVGQPRMIKSEAEIDYLRSSANITMKALDAALPMIRAGVTDNQIAAVIYHSLINEGSEYFSTQPIVSAGQRNWFLHTTFKRTPIQVGDTVELEFGAAYQRYTSAICHTVAVGKPSPLVEARSKAINETLDLLFQAVKPGRNGHDIAREIGVGMNDVSPAPSATRMYGYSIGLGFPPTWGEELYFIREGIDLELKPGMTFHTVLAIDKPGTPGVGFSETWVVTESGYEILTAHDRELSVVDA